MPGGELREGLAAEGSERGRESCLQPAGCLPVLAGLGEGAPRQSSHACEAAEAAEVAGVRGERV